MLFSNSALLACFWNENSKKKVLSFSRWTTQQMWLNRWKSGNSINNNFKGKNIPNGARWLIGRARQKHNEQEKGHETKKKDSRRRKREKATSHAGVHGPAVPSLDSDSPLWWPCRTRSEGPSSGTGACVRGRRPTPAASPAARWPWQHLAETGWERRERPLSVRVWVLMPKGWREREGKRNALHSITLTAQPCERRRSESMGGIMEIDLVKASWGKKDRLHWLGSMHSDQGRRNKSGTHLLKGNTSCWEQVPAGITKLSH